MKSLIELLENVTDPSYRKTPKKFGDIEDITKQFAEDIVKTLLDTCENDGQQRDFLTSLIRNIWFEMPKEDRRKNLLPALQHFTD